MTLEAFQKKKYEINLLHPKATSKFAKKLNPKSAPRAGGQIFVPEALEKELAFIVTYLRDKNLPVRKPFIKSWMDEALTQNVCLTKAHWESR